MSGALELEWELIRGYRGQLDAITSHRYEPYPSNCSEDKDTRCYLTATASNVLQRYGSSTYPHHQTFANFIKTNVVDSVKADIESASPRLTDYIFYMADEPEVYRSHWYLPPNVLGTYRNQIRAVIPNGLASIGYGPVHGNTYFYHLCAESLDNFTLPPDERFPLPKEGRINLDDYKRALDVHGNATRDVCGDATLPDSDPEQLQVPATDELLNVNTHVKEVVAHYEDHTDLHLINSYAAINADAANAARIVGAIKEEDGDTPVWMWFWANDMNDDPNDERDDGRSFGEIRSQVYTAIASKATGVMIYADEKTSSTDLDYAGQLAAALHKDRDILSAKFGTTGTAQCGLAGTEVAYYAVKAVSRGESTDEYLLISNPTNGICEASLPASLGGPVSLRARESRIRHLLNLQARWVIDGSYLFAHDKARLTWDDPGNAAITGWEYRQQEGNSGWGVWQEASSSASTVTKVVDGLKIWRTYRFQVRARYGPGVDDRGPESGQAVLAPWLEFTQAPTVGLLGGAGKVEFEVGIDWPVDLPDLPEGSGRIRPEDLQVQVETTTATGEITESDFVVLASIEEVLPGAALVETPSETDLPPREAPAAGASGADDQTASPQVVTSIRVSGLDPGVTYRFKVRLLRPDGVTGSASSAASVLGLRWQRQTGAVELSWTDPADPAEPAIHAWEYRQQAGSGSWGLWQSVSGSTGSTTTHTVSGLSEAVTYRFQVRGVGPGGPNAESFTVSAPVGPPSVPQRFRAAAGDGQVLLTWAAPASTGGLPLLGYHYREIVAGDTTGWLDFLKGWTRYMPQNLENGVAHTFEVRAYTRAGAGASADTTVTPAGAPRAPGHFTAAPGDGQVTLSWTAADSNGAPVTAYEVRHAPKSDLGTEGDWSEVSWSEVPGDSTARDTTITGLTNGTTHVFQAAARNRVNLGTPAEKEATLPDPLPPTTEANRKPVLSGPDSVWYAEGGQDSVARYPATDTDGDELSWSLGGVDEADFSVRGDTLFFRSAPDYEQPSDRSGTGAAAGDNVYQITVSVSDGRAADGTVDTSADTTAPVVVTVTNAPEAGTVTLSTTQPKVGMHLTATLTDPDRGVTDDLWSWEELAGASAAQQQPRGQAQSFRYTVEDRVKGQRLLAKVRYTDGHGPDQAASDTTAAVQADVPGAPGSLQATAGDRRVTLRWTAADSNGAWITGYAYRDSTDTAGSTWSAWPGTPQIAGDATSHAVTGLDNGTGYTFEVRAVNPVGAGPASSPASATPQAGGTPPPCSLSLSGVKTSPVSYAENGTGAVDTYTATRSSSCDATLPLTWSRAGTDASDFRELSGTGSSRALHFDDPPNFEAKRSHSVTVQVTDGSASASLPVTVNVTNQPEAGTITLSPSPPMTCAHVNATLEDVDGGITTESSASPPNFTYGWEWDPPSAAASGSQGTSTTQSYLPPNSLVGQTAQVTVQYGDRASDRNTATRTSGTVAANTPRTPTGLKSTPGDRRVSLTWKAPNDCGSTITGYRYWYRKKSQTAWEDSGGAAETSVTVPGLDNHVRYRFEIRAANGAGRSGAGAIDGTPVPPCALSLSGVKTSPVSYAENGTGAVDTYTATRSSSMRCDAAAHVVAGRDRRQ